MEELIIICIFIFAMCWLCLHYATKNNDITEYKKIDNEKSDNKLSKK